MEVFLLGALVVALVAAAIGIMQIVRYEKELRSLAQFLDEHKGLSNARITTSMRTRGVLQLGTALNEQLDMRHGDARIMQEQSRELRDGLAYLSHDIRTPLMGARGYLQLEQAEVDPAERKRYLASVDERLDALQSILDQLFIFTQVSNEEHAVECREVALGDIVSEVLVSFYPQFEELGWVPQVDLDETRDNMVLADPEALRRIIENLTSNALKHGSGAPTIEQSGTCLKFSNPVADPQSLDVDCLFDRFYMANTESRGKGSGLGLAIVKQLATSMNAQIKATLIKNTLEIEIVFPGIPDHAFDRQ